MEPMLIAVAGTALAEGVKFLYAQASEVLKAWRARRRGGTDATPVMIPPPPTVAVEQPDPLLQPRDTSMEDTLNDLRDRAHELTAGTIEPSSPEGRRIISDLRAYLEVVLRTPITFVGEEPRTFEVRDVEVVAARVEGDVAGVRLSGGGSALVEGVRVETNDVAGTGRVTGVEKK